MYITLSLFVVIITEQVDEKNYVNVTEYTMSGGHNLCR